MNTLRTAFTARLASFAFAALFTAGMLGGVNALAVIDAPLQMAQVVTTSPV